MSSNGLIECTSVCGNGAIDSAFYLRSGAPIASPLQIVSPDGTQVLSLSEANDGTATISTNGGPMVLQSADDTILLKAQSSETTGVQIQPVNETLGVGGLVIRNGATSSDPSRFGIFNSSVSGGGLTAGNLDVFGYSSSGPTIIRRCATINPLGDSIVLGDLSIVGGADVSVAGSLGASRVFDGIYNPVPADTLSAVLTADNSAGSSQINMNSQKIVNVLDPTDAQDAATKSYVDGIAARPLIRSYTTTLTTGTDATSWEVPANGTYEVEVIVDSAGATLASGGVFNTRIRAVGGAVISGSSCLKTADTMYGEGGFTISKTNYSVILTRNFNTSPQLYEIDTYATVGSVAGGAVTINIFRIA
jgi:hypothetical protein